MSSSWLMPCVLALINLLSVPVFASSGDAASVFISCVEHCRYTSCAPSTTHPHKCRFARACKLVPAAHVVPWYLSLFQWSCPDDCRYQCMAEIELMRHRAGRAPQKYFGKWPFIRVYGIQEFASVVFSLLNLAAHVHCLIRLIHLTLHGKQGSSEGRARGRQMSRDIGSRSHKSRSRSRGKGSEAQGSSVDDAGEGPGLSPGSSGATKGAKALKGRRQGTSTPGAKEQRSPPASSTGQYPYLWVWLLYGVLHCVAWASSAAFHTRDTHLTERIDYMAAGAVVFMGLVAAVVRVFALRPRPAVLVLLAVAAGLAVHARYMLTIKFDYDWNMKVCLTVGGAGALLWLAWALVARAGRTHPGRSALLLFLLLGHMAILLEVLDFPPLIRDVDMMDSDINSEPGQGLVDAHALWHAATVPLTYLFYVFILTDARLHLGLLLPSSPAAPPPKAHVASVAASNAGKAS